MLTDGRPPGVTVGRRLRGGVSERLRRSVVRGFLVVIGVRLVLGGAGLAWDASILLAVSRTGAMLPDRPVSPPMSETTTSPANDSGSDAR